jgi:hypothetical protein
MFVRGTNDEQGTQWRAPVANYLVIIRSMTNNLQPA